MPLFIFIVTIWFFPLFLIRPKPADLRAKIPNHLESFKEIQVTFWLGILLCVIFFIFSGGSFTQTKQDLFALYGVNNVEVFTPWWFVQTFTHNFIHLDIFHLFANLSLLGLLSIYERNVKGKRLLAVFLFSGVLSSVSVFFFSGPVITAGASSGILGLGAAFFLDNPKLTLKEYALGVVGIFILYWYMGLRKQPEILKSYNIDEWGHLFGIALGALYCKVFPNKPCRSR